jgi:hypothetical protein
MQTEHVDLPSGGWAKIRLTRLRGDRIAVRDAIKIHYADDGSHDIPMSIEDTGIGALLTHMITSWSFGPIPADCVNPYDALNILTDDDGETLADAVRHHYDVIMKKKKEGGNDPKPPAKTISGSVSSTSTPADPAPPSLSIPNGTSGSGVSLPTSSTPAT